ncbi:MAG: antitoxin Xre/MbcA/ParS toxin-binding domain-containing protein [Roseateles sp.]
MDSGDATARFVAAQRAALDRLEVFRRTPGYASLLAKLRRSPGGDVEAWLAAWLIEPESSLGGRPLDIAAETGGLVVLLDHLEALGSGTGA